MELRRLGRLEHRSSVLIYGAAALSDVDQDSADASISRALAAGVNHFDVAASYGDAELRLGTWMPRVRAEIFLATKTGERERDAAWAQINASLERLQTDHVDLIQLHAVGDLSDLDRAVGRGGALEAAVRAADEGLAGAVGITGHGPLAAATHREALRRYPFATVLTPLNAVLWRDAAFRTAYAELVAEAKRQDAALLTIKTVARRNWPTAPDTGSARTHATWYEPFDTAEQVRAAVSWVLAHRELTGLATPGDVGLLDLVIAAERDRMDPDEAAAVLANDAAYSSPFLAMPF